MLGHDHDMASRSPLPSRLLPREKRTNRRSAGQFHEPQYDQRSTDSGASLAEETREEEKLLPLSRPSRRLGCRKHIVAYWEQHMEEARKGNRRKKKGTTGMIRLCSSSSLTVCAVTVRDPSWGETGCRAWTRGQLC